uniref:PemK-like protein n=1 Tax=Podoviridae sp. ctZih56 TaxID=2827741 RepID=A0A8S5SF90_9CAUD|nr:MAG TPA: PemK-like protein [Podoviridae sp. ctZih56]
MTKKNLKRGEVYYIEGAKGAAGAEMVKTRPGIVISDQNQVEDSHVVTVVYLSHKKQTGNRAHVPMTHEGLRGVALCEHIYTVDIDRAGDYICTLTDEELEAVLCGVDSVIGGDPDREDLQGFLAEAERDLTELRGRYDWQVKCTETWQSQAEEYRKIILDAMAGGCTCGKK